MKKNALFLSLASLGLLVAGLVGCNGNNTPSEASEEPPVSSQVSEQPSSEKKSSEKQSSSKASSSEKSSEAASSSKQDVHEHTYELSGTAVKNADGKDVYVKECTAKDDKYIGMAFTDYSELSSPFDPEATASKYSHVDATIMETAVMMAKNSTIKWKFNLDKAVTGAKIAFGVTITSESHTSQDCAQKHTVAVNGGDAAAWDLDGKTYGDCNFAVDTVTYVVFKTADLVAGENTIELAQTNAGYRLLFSGELRVYYSGDAKPVEAPIPFEGYNITFTTDHCKVLVYSGKDYSATPEETNTTKAKDEEGNIVAYDPEDIELQPQVNFKVVCDEGYSVNATNITITGKFKNLKQNPAKSETPAVDDDSLFRVTKVQEDLTIAIVAVKGEQAQGYKVTFVTAHCSVKVYVGPKNTDGTNLDTAENGVYYARLKDSPYDIGFTTPQINFEVICDEGYEFVPEIVDDKVTFIQGDYNKFQLKAGVYNMTKIASDLTITITATLKAAA